MKTWSQLAVFTLLFLGAAEAAAQVAPEKALATLTVSKGLEAQLWASEPMFCNPTIMDVDHKGRVWVVESVNYRSTLGMKSAKEPKGDRILILEDSKDTGKADKVTVFYQAPDVLAPLGIAVLPHPDGPGCTVYVGQSPNIWVFEDKDGDGKADGPPRKLLSGFKGIDHDHGVHGLFIGPDNKLYFTVGDQGVQGLVDKNGRKWTSNQTDCRAGTCWRCDLDGKNLELLAHNFRNQYEMCSDSFGTLFVSDNDDDGNRMTRICYVMPGGNYGYHPRGKGQTHWHEEQPGVVPMILRTFQGSPTGMCFYEGKLLPEQYRGQPLHVDAGPGRLSSYHLTDKGAAYSIDREDIIKSSDSWFRPSDVCVAPDGSVFVSDWYDPGVGGHNVRDFARGRIYRVIPKGAKTTTPTVDVTTNAGVTAALASPNVATRAMAMAKIDKLDQSQALEILIPAATQKEDAVLRARALWQLGRRGNLKLVNAAYSDPDPRFRVLAMRILSDCKDFSPADYTPEWRDALVKDPSAAVRREALLLLRAVEATKAKSVIVELARKWDGKDRFYLCAVGIAFGQPGARRDALLSDFEKQFPGWDDKMPGLIWELRPPQVLALLTKKLADTQVPTGQRAMIVDVLAASTEAGAPAVVLKALTSEKSPEVRDAIVAALRKNLPSKWTSLRKSDVLNAAVGSMLKQPGTMAAAMDLIAAAGMEEMMVDIGRIALSDKEQLATRIAALRALGQLRNGIPPLLSALNGQRQWPSELLVEAALALGQHSTEAAAFKTLQGLTQDKAVALPVRQAAVAGLSNTQNGSTWLLDEHGKQALAADLVPDASRLLRGSPYQNVRKLANAAFPAPPPIDPKSLPSIPALLARKGNPERGKQLVAASVKSDAQCLKCHTINNVGGQVGPDLSTIGSKASRENLLESILYPSRAIADQFQQYQVETKQGLLINALIIEETKEFVLLRDANVKDYKIALGDIEKRQRIATSLMPELIQYLPEQDLVDIVDYLGTLKSVPLGPPNE